MRQYRVYIDCENNGTKLELVTAREPMAAYTTLARRTCKLPMKVRELKISRVLDNGRTGTV